MNKDLFSEDNESTAVDSVGIPGYDKVNRLAEAVLKLGSFVTNLEVCSVKRLYDDLDEFHRRGLTFSPHFKKGKGRFHKSKNRSAHIGVESMARFFLLAQFLNNVSDRNTHRSTFAFSIKFPR